MHVLSLVQGQISTASCCEQGCLASLPEEMLPTPKDDIQFVRPEGGLTSMLYYLLQALRCFSQSFNLCCDTKLSEVFGKRFTG